MKEVRIIFDSIISLWDIMNMIARTAKNVTKHV